MRILHEIIQKYLGNIVCFVMARRVFMAEEGERERER